MEIAQLIVNTFVALVIAAVGWYLANNYRLQTRIRLLELRVGAYRKLFELTEITSPTRLGRDESLSEEDARQLGRAIYDWYYRDGNGLLMPNDTRQRLQSLQQKLQGEPVRSRSADPLLREVSEFRAALRRDVGVFASDELGRELAVDEQRRWWRTLLRRR